MLMQISPFSPGGTGEICMIIKNGIPCGLAYEYYRSPEVTAQTWRDGFYHTGDLAWRDEDGFYWYVGRADDVIKSSGYRIGPFEIENVIMELPYVLECGVSAAPDEIRGTVILHEETERYGSVGADDYLPRHTGRNAVAIFIHDIDIILRRGFSH